MSALMREDQASPVEDLRQQILDKKEKNREQRRLDQLQVEKKDAIPKRETGEIHVRQASNDSEEMGGRTEEEKGVSRDEDEAEEKNDEVRGIKFTKGKKVFDIDEDAEIEFVADKKTIKMTVREMRDAAAGGVAVRNRMRQLAEDRKSLQEPLTDFVKFSKDDPIGALQRMFKTIQKIDPEANFNTFVNALAQQAQRIASMGPEARKAYQLEKDLKEKDELLNQTEQKALISEMKAELMETTGLTEEKIFSYGTMLLDNPVISEEIKSEADLMNRIGEFAEEVEMQKACFEALRKYKADISPRDPLILELSSILKRNPDFDEKDLDEIAEEVLSKVDKHGAAKRLSKKSRWTTGTQEARKGSAPNYDKMKPVDALRHQILEKKRLQLEKRGIKS